MKYKYLFLHAILILFTLSTQAQQTPLPKGLTAQEKEILSSFTFRSNRRTPPPALPVRTAAEWEEVEYLLVTWDPSFDDILTQIVAVGVTECKVIITTQDEEEVAAALTSSGISLTNITFLNAGWDSIWIRDYSANTVYTNDVGERALVDWIYNRPRPQDNIMPQQHASETGVPLYVTNSGSNDLVNTGGNFMTDGLGTAFASKLILSENEEDNDYGVTAKTEEDIDDIMEAYMGISNFIKMPVLPYDGIHHIDMHMKLLDEETLLVSRYPDGVADGPQIEENIDYILSNFQSPFGTPYRIKWIDAPADALGDYPDTGGSYYTYSNALILNKSVLVPIYRPETDIPALAIYEELMPGYTIVGIDVDENDEPLINLSGALHCITHTIGTAEPLLIVHQPVREAATGATVSIGATIKHISGISGAKVFWRNKGDDTFNQTVMLLTGGDNWAANITTDAEGADMEYYVWAQADSGKSISRPIVAPQGYWTIATETLSSEEWAYKNITGPYPNPASGTVNFSFNNLGGPVAVTITNVLGQRLYTGSVENADGTLTLQLNAEWNGTLFVTFTGSFGQVTKKVVKI